MTDNVAFILFISTDNVVFGLFISTNLLPYTASQDHSEYNLQRDKMVTWKCLSRDVLMQCDKEINSYLHIKVTRTMSAFYLSVLIYLFFFIWA